VSVDETLRAIDGVLSGHPDRWLGPEPELEDKVTGVTVRGAPKIVRRLRELTPSSGVRLTVDIGRGVAEWEIEGARPIVGVFEVEGAAVRSIRLYAGNIPAGPELTDLLTPRERAIASMVATGMSNADVAKELVLSYKTIEFHLRNIFRKLGVTNRTQLASLRWTTD